MPSDIVLEVLNGNNESQELFDFIESCPGGTIFHHPKFLSYHGESKFSQPGYSLAHILLRRKGTIAGFMPGILCKEGGLLKYLSPYGASFGGIVTKDTSFERMEALVDAVVSFLIDEAKADEINITPPTSIYMGDGHNDYLEYLYLSKGFTVNDSALTVVTKIARGESFPGNILKDRVKSSVGQAKRKGIQCRISEDMGSAWRIIESDQKKFGKKPTHSLDELRSIAKLFPGRILPFMAYHKDEPIAVVCVFLCNKSVAYAFYIDQMEEHAASRPLDLVIVDILAWLKREGYKYIDFGPSTFGKEPHRTLIFFKEGFGGKGIIKNFFQYKVSDKTRAR